MKCILILLTFYYSHFLYLLPCVTQSILQSQTSCKLKKFWQFKIFWTQYSCLLGRHSVTWATPATFLLLGNFEIGSCDLFAWAGFEPRSSWYLPPEYAELQARTTAHFIYKCVYDHVCFGVAVHLLDLAFKHFAFVILGMTFFNLKSCPLIPSIYLQMI
jgi:hypothetical protein